MAYKMQNITVLIVDSQPAMVDLIKGVLHLFGIKNIIARVDGERGLEAFKQHNPDLMIVDWDLDNLDGIEFTKMARSSITNPFVPIIFMTSLTSEKRVRQARDSGITEFMRKPFTADALYKRLEEIIERPRQFVRTEEFFGPDRRRHRKATSDGKERRDPDSAVHKK